MNLGQGHHLTRYNSSPALNGHGQSPHHTQSVATGSSNNGAETNNNYITPRNSFDSLGSFRSFANSSNGNSTVAGGPVPTSSAGAGNPWSSSYGGAFAANSKGSNFETSKNINNPGFAPGGSFSRNSSAFSTDGSVDAIYRSQPSSAGGGGANSANGPPPPSIPQLDTFGENSLMNNRMDDQELSHLSSLLNNAGVGLHQRHDLQRPPSQVTAGDANTFSGPSQAHQKQNQQTFASVAAGNFASHSSHPNVSNDGSTPVSTLQLVDPAIEQAFRNMAKSIGEKDKQLSQLKTELEAVLTAVSVGGVSDADKTVLETAVNRKLDGNEMAHRMVTKLKTLKQENANLGKMLSQGRAAQKDVEIGILRRENAMLKAQIDSLSTGQASKQQAASHTPIGPPSLASSNNIGTSQEGSSQSCSPQSTVAQTPNEV